MSTGLQRVSTGLRGLRPGGRHDQWGGVLPRMVVADVDGTLVGPTGNASDSVRRATARVADAGIPIGFATGRMRLATGRLHGQLGLTGPHLFHNGAEVVHRGETIAAWPLSDGDVMSVLDIARRDLHYVELYTSDGYVVNREDVRAHPHWDLLGSPPSAVVDAPPVGPVLKATFGLFYRAAVPGLVAALESAGLRAGPAESPVTPGIVYVNATAADVDKGTALVVAAGAVGRDPSEVLAIGDAHNDLPLLAAAGTAVAMGQAAPEIAAAAHFIAPRVTDDGVADVLSRLLADLTHR